MASTPDPSRTGSPSAGITVAAVAEGQWDILGWLWQGYREGLAPVVAGRPYADGRYQHQELDGFPSSDGVGYLAWQAHPNTGVDAPVGFALVDGLLGPRRSMVAFWTAPAVRRHGIGLVLARDVLGRHTGPWSIGFQHENVPAGRFWRAVADEAFGPGSWVEQRRPVPGKPAVPADHWILTR